MPSTFTSIQNSKSLNAASNGLLMRTTTSAPPRRTLAAAAGTIRRAASFCAAGTLSSRSSWMQSAPRVCALATYFSTFTGTYRRDRQTGRSGFTGDDAFLLEILYFRRLQAERFQYFFIVLAELRRRRADRAGRAGEARHHVVHRKRAHLGVRIVGQQLALDDVRVLEDLRNVVDRADGDLGLFEESDVVRLAAPGNEGADDGIQLLGVLHPVYVGPVARIVDEIRAADGAERALGHFLRGGREPDVLAVVAEVDVARRGIGRAAAGARPRLAGQPVIRRLRPERREQRVEQRHVDDLAAAGQLGRAQRDQRGRGAVESRDGVGEVHRRQHGLAVAEAVHRRKARHAFDQRAEAGPAPVRPILAPAGDAHHHQLW